MKQIKSKVKGANNSLLNSKDMITFREFIIRKSLLLKQCKFNLDEMVHYHNQYEQYKLQQLKEKVKQLKKEG